MPHHRFAMLAAVAGLLQATAAHAAQPLLSITDLGQATGLSNLQAVDINNRGDVLLNRDASVVSYVWNASTGLTDIKADGQAPLSMAISDDGEVVGITSTFEGLLPFRWDPVGGFLVPRLEPGLEGGSLSGVNALGQVVGTSKSIASDKDRAIGGNEEGALRRLRGAGNGPSAAYAINASGQMGGWVKVSGICCKSAALFGKKAGDLTLLGTLANDGERDESWVSALNDVGQVVGTSQTGGRPHAFIWSATTGMRDLHPRRDGRGQSYAGDINRSGMVVGSLRLNDQYSSFSWDSTHGSVDLSDRIDPTDPLRAVTVLAGGPPKINDHGQIVMNATVRGVWTAVLLSPVQR